ncbi:hypothetical protein ABW19_dt0200151 [Dactylella cylindrospora]|nr:hypothetical protein ABW19_dt0200151 [Dactylella cylindrospora]
MSHDMEYSFSSSSFEDDFTLYPPNSDFASFAHPSDDMFFPGDDFSLFPSATEAPDAMAAEIDEVCDMGFIFPQNTTVRESEILGLCDPLPPTYPNARPGQACIGNYMNPSFLDGENGYPTPPSTLSSPYSPPTNTFSTFVPPAAPRTRRQSTSSRRRSQVITAALPPSPTPSSPTGGKQGIFTCHKCNAVFTFKTNKTRHVNSRACERTSSSSATEVTKEFPCPIDGCPTVIKRRRDNLAVHMRKIHGLKMEVNRQ